MPSPFYTTTPRYALRSLLGTSNVSDTDAGFLAALTDIENAFTGYKSGTNAARLAATNLDGLLWRETDTGQLWLGGGASWIRISTVLRTLIGTATAFVGPSVSGGNYFIAADGTLVASGSATTKPLMWWYLDPANYAPVATPPQLIIRMSLGVNVTAPAITFAGELASLTFGGGSGVITPSFSSQQGPSAAIASPAASSPAVAESSAFTFPTAGAYAPVINLSGSTAAASGTSITWQLFVPNN